MLHRSLARLAGVALLALALPAGAQDTADPDQVVARVGDDEITLGHMIALRSRLPEQFASAPPEQLFAGILDQLVSQSAMAQGIEPTPRSIELTLENERRALMANLALREAAEAGTSEEAVRALYEERFSGDLGTEYNASHILVETQEEAQAIIDELEAGADFAQLAQERSTGPSGPGGGELGWFTEGTMVPEFQAAVSGLEPGEVSEPVQTQFGWHVVRLNDERSRQAPPFEQVRGELASAASDQAVRDAVEAAREAVSIEMMDTTGLDPTVLGETALIE